MDVLHRTADALAAGATDPATAGPAPSRARERALVALIIALGAGFFLATIRAGHAWGDDFAQYIGHARNLVEGRPYGSTGYLYNPAVPFGGPRTYPPVFPLMLAPIVKLFGAGVYALKVELIAFFAGALTLLYTYVRRHGSFARAAGTVALIAFSPFFWDFKDNVLSDVPFLLIVVASLIVIDRATEKDHAPRNALLWGLAAGVITYLAFGTRTLGVVLIPTLIGTELYRRRRVSRATVVAVASFAVLAALQMKLVPGGGSYLDDLKLQSPRLVAVNGWRYLKALERVAFNGFSMPVAHVFFAALLVLAAIGFVARLRRDRFSPAEAFVPLYALAVVAWPIYQDTRLLIPVIPFFLAYAIEGAASLRVPRATIVLAACFALSYVSLFARLDFGPIREGVEKPESRQVFAWIREHTAPTDVIVFRRPKALALYSGRSSSGYAPGLADAEQLTDLRRMNARYLLASDLDPAYLAGFLGRNAAAFEPVYRNGDFVLYRLRAA